MGHLHSRKSISIPRHSDVSLGMWWNEVSSAVRDRIDGDIRYPWCCVRALTHKQNQEKKKRIAEEPPVVRCSAQSYRYSLMASFRCIIP